MSTKNNFKDFRKDRGKDKTEYLLGSNIIFEKRDKIINTSLE